jgi:cytochrome d ubiquinol oxidase subunit I
VQFPWILGVITTRSFDRDLPGITELTEHAALRIANGLKAYNALQVIKADPDNSGARATFDESRGDLGYALLLKKYRPDIENASGEEIVQASLDTVPDVWPLFWSFRIMVGCGFFFIGFFALWFYKASIHRFEDQRWLLWACVLALPLPWLAIELGWLIAEYGRQPWVVEGVLPTFYAASGLKVSDLAISLVFFVTLYTALIVVELFLMVKAIKKGPSDTFGLDDGAEPVEPAEAVPAK